MQFLIEFSSSCSTFFSLFTSQNVHCKYLLYRSGTYEKHNIWSYTAIPYRVSTGPEQGIPCVVFPHRENPVFISWDPCNENRFFPVGNTTQGKPCFHYRDGFAVCLKQQNKCLKLVKMILQLGISAKISKHRYSNNRVGKKLP